MSDISLSDKIAIEEARASYEALKYNLKSLIDEKTLKKLTDSENALDNIYVNAVKEKINSLPSKDEMKETDKALVEEARTSYEALTDKHKKLIDNETINKLTDAENTISWIVTGIPIDEAHFPDNNLRTIIQHQYGYAGDGSTVYFIIDADANGMLTKSECDRVTSFYVDFSIHDTTGLNYFENLKDLICYNGTLSNLNISGNTKLETINMTGTSVAKLDCSNNGISELDLSNNTKLNTLKCNNNLLTSLDVRNSTLLKELYCYSNQLTSLDVNENTALEYLYCYSNQLTINKFGCE